MRKCLIKMTRNKPMKQIDVQGQPYLQRYYLGSLAGVQFWLHRFLSADGDRHHHNHPWRALSVVLAGRYTEHLLSGQNLTTRSRRPLGMPAIIGRNRTHRIGWNKPETWTLMIVGPRRFPFWSFINTDGSEERVATSARDWWRYCGTRPDS